jgi:plastocyanin
MTFKRRVHVTLAALMLILAGITPSASAADQSVTIANFNFSPTTLTINVGDSVTWTNSDPVAHTTTSDSSVWNSGPLAQGGTFQRTFSEAGLFNYFCSIHPSMRGTILVGTRTYLPVVIR